jgi:hypothetical protein
MTALAPLRNEGMDIASKIDIDLLARRREVRRVKIAPCQAGLWGKETIIGADGT